MLSSFIGYISETAGWRLSTQLCISTVWSQAHIPPFRCHKKKIFLNTEWWLLHWTLPSTSVSWTLNLVCWLKTQKKWMHRASTFSLDQALACGPYLANCLCIKVLLDGTQSCPFTSYIFYGWFCATAAELSRYNRLHG